MYDTYESWSDPASGRRLRRRALGSCSSGKLVLRANGHGADLYWLGDDPTNILDYRLQRYGRPRMRATCLWHVTKLPPGRYWVDINRRGGGCELFVISAALPLSVEPPPVQSPLDQLFGRAVLHSPPPRKPIFLRRPPIVSPHLSQSSLFSHFAQIR
jgi:hypothetical protein